MGVAAPSPFLLTLRGRLSVPFWASAQTPTTQLSDRRDVQRFRRSQSPGHSLVSQQQEFKSKSELGQDRVSRLCF